MLAFGFWGVMPPCKQNNTSLTAAITAQKSKRSLGVLLVGVRETPITAMEFTVFWPALYLNENYVDCLDHR
mgnify:CR=1 FL=1